jgi:hypothetical protein
MTMPALMITTMPKNTPLPLSLPHHVLEACLTPLYLLARALAKESTPAPRT